MVRIALVAGEASGDLLGAGLIQAIKRRMPGAEFEGIAGPNMIKQGCKPLYPSEKLAVMGLTEVLVHYRELHAIRADVIKRLIANPPDVFIGIDAPDFNIGLELKLKAAGIRTIHYVSPTVWAWRQYRVKKIARAVDLILTLFPFEAEFFKAHDVAVSYVGHPLADLIPLETDVQSARTKLTLPDDSAIVALLPGSRLTEVKNLSEYFIKAAYQCLQARSNMHFVAPFINQNTRNIFENILQKHAPELPITLIDGDSRTAMAAADVVLTASGTAALEALLLKKPMVVAYRLAPLTYLIFKRLIRLDYYSSPNLLANEPLVPEFIQNQVTSENLSKAILNYFEQPEKMLQLHQSFNEIHRKLMCGANDKAAESVLELIK